MVRTWKDVKTWKTKNESFPLTLTNGSDSPLLEWQTQGQYMAFGPDYNPFFYVVSEFSDALQTDDTTSDSEYYAYRYVRVENPDDMLRSPFRVIGGSARMVKRSGNRFSFYFAAKHQTKEAFQIGSETHPEFPTPEQFTPVTDGRELEFEITF